MKDKLTIQNKWSYFLREISLKFEISSFFSGSKQQEKQHLRELENYISYRMCLANDNFILVLDVTFFVAPPGNVLSKIADLSHYF